MGFTTLALVGLAALQGTLAHGDAPASGVSGECKPSGMAIIDTLLCIAFHYILWHANHQIRHNLGGKVSFEKSPSKDIALDVWIMYAFTFKHC
jgi:hypothetical protein